MECKILFTRETRKNMSLTSAEFANCMLSVNHVFSVCNSCIYFAFSLELDFVCLYFVYHSMGKLSR